MDQGQSLGGHRRRKCARTGRFHILHESSDIWLRYDVNQLRTEPWIPYQDERRVIKMSWSIVSKAAERSSRQRHDIFCDPIAAVEAIIRIGWNKFRQLVPLLINKDVSLIMRGRLYSSCVRSSMLHGSEKTWWHFSEQEL